MRTWIREWSPPPSPERLAAGLAGEPGTILLLGGWPDARQARFSLLVRKPFLTVQVRGSRLMCAWRDPGGEQVVRQVHFGNPWVCLHSLWSRYELRDEPDLPFPLGGIFGFWGYELNRFVEPSVTPRALRDLNLPDAWLGFYDSLVCWDHALDKAWVLATGLMPDGLRTVGQARRQLESWERLLEQDPAPVGPPVAVGHSGPLQTSLSREAFLRRVERALAYIRQGDIYQVNLSQRLSIRGRWNAWELFRRLRSVCPAPGSAYLNAGRFQLVSATPELFLQMSGTHVVTRPIKGTRPRGADPIEDARLACELRASVKETAELVMITDLLRNDLGRICEFGTVRVPELVRVETHPQVHHLVSTVEGWMRPQLSHLEALAALFPGGSVTGAPKVRAMQIIEELEPVQRGFFTGALGYLGFNRESRLLMIIRTACCAGPWMHHPVGAGIVADSDPQMEYEETLAKARGWWQAIRDPGQTDIDGAALAERLIA